MENKKDKKMSCEEALNLLQVDYRDRVVYLKLYSSQIMTLSSWKNKINKK